MDKIKTFDNLVSNLYYVCSVILFKVFMKKYTAILFLSVIFHSNYGAALDLDSLNHTKWIAEIDDSNGSITLNFENGRINGKAACNYYMGKIEESSPNHVRVSSLATTKMLCSPPVMKLESEFLHKLGATDLIQQPNVDSLYLYSDQSEYIVFTRSNNSN